MILITTPDYYPKIGGLTTLTMDLERSLCELGVPCEVFQWNSIKDILNYSSSKLSRYSYVINMHYMFGLLKGRHKEVKMVNFVCGTEILFSSPVFWKRILKKIFKYPVLQHLERCFLNVFISEFTYELLQSFGYKTDRSRDVVHHCAINTTKHHFQLKEFDTAETLKFICLARDVKHKNLAGAVKFCEIVAQVYGKKVIEIRQEHQNVTCDQCGRSITAVGR
jgi:glycosyltransferase involved in cell wall biosynthesis